MNWEKEFNVTASQVKQEIARIKKEKQEYYDDGKVKIRRTYYQELRGKLKQ